ncbi:amidase family protein [Qipengyuania soli]|uniref:Amidase n=1 Tax=Qipengyuania soli TaxID=2782568 RepID=A0A7S8IU07_9SPHN|nr:amidase family protein [Qipengyuania soli]QPC97785.1 amidase [Qipengyuania soli]
MAYPKLTKQPGALETAAAIRNGSMSPIEAVEAAIARIEHHDAHINAVAVTDFDRARDAAKALGKRQPSADEPLFGVPMTVKESFNVAGLPTTFGHEQYADNIVDKDAEVVRLLKGAGAIILGKTNVPPDLADLQSNNPVYGRTNNPHDHDRVAGGSSGGSAAAVASGMVPCEYGSDIGSSIRNPAHFNGIYGHKTSFGLVSRRGHTHPAAGGLDVHEGPLSVVGPLARSAEDLTALLEITTARPLVRREKSLSECRFLAVLEHPVSEVDASVRVPIEEALAELEKAGATIDRTSALLPDLAELHADYLRLLNVAMARGRPAPGGKEMSLVDYYLLLDRQARCEYAWGDLFAEYDFVLAPPLPFLAYKHDATPINQRRITINGKDSAFADALAWAGIATYPNLPSTVVPVGATDGLPCGMQVMGPRWSDLDCIATAGAIGKLLHG